jgi:hypothetical protein
MCEIIERHEFIECGKFALATNEALTQLLKLICRLPEPENKALHRAIGAAIGELLSRRADELAPLIERGITHN